MKNLHLLRKKVGISQKNLAKLLDVEEITVWRWENDKASPTAETLKRISEVLGVSVDELLNGPRENIIEVTLRYEPDIKGGVIDMGTGNGYALTVADNGMVGISGAAIFKTRADLDKALNKIKAMLEEGFARQVEKGLASEE